MKKTLQVMFCVGILFFTYSQAEAQKKKKKSKTDATEKAAVVTPTEDTKTLIQRKWQIDVEFFKAELKSEADKLRATNPEKASELESQIGMMDMMAGITMEFKANGVMEVGAMGQVEKAGWKLGENDKVLIMINPEGKEDKLNIKTISKEKLLLEDPSSEGGTKKIALIAAK